MLGRPQQIPQTGGRGELKQQEIIFSQFWRLEVQDQGVGRVVSPEASLLGVQMERVFLLCPCVPLCPSIPDVLCVPIPFLPRCVASGILVPQPGIEPRPSAVKAWSPNHWTAREFASLFLYRDPSDRIRGHPNNLVLT